MTNNIAAIYCRLSKDDEQCGDSVSIETQRMMLTQYCADHFFNVFDIYIDDGYSGLNFDRPSFKRLIEDLEEGKFDIVITKDLSRLGRDYIQTGYYIDVYFSMKQVRYIAVNDGIDTQCENNDIAPFKNILNDMYAKDLSRKVKSAKHQRALNGLYISSQTPYGYRVNPENRNQLILDEGPAQIVKMIYDLAEEGMNFSQISRELEARKIITPANYKAMNGDTRFLKYTMNPDEVYKWHYQTVRTILLNPVYAGDMVNHKYETINYKTKKRVRVPTEERIVVPDMHEAIVSRERFERMQDRVTNRRVANHNLENIFKGLIYCAECGKELQLISVKLKNGRQGMFRCVQHVVDTNVCKHHHFIYYRDIYEQVKDQLNAHIEDALETDEYDELYERICMLVESQIYEQERNNLQKELTLVNKKIKEYYKTNKIQGVQQNYANELQLLTDRQKELIRQITNQGSKSRERLVLQIDRDDLKKRVKQYAHILSLNDKTLRLFVKKIEIGHLERTTNGTIQRVCIYYYF